MCGGGGYSSFEGGYRFRNVQPSFLAAPDLAISKFAAPFLMVHPQEQSIENHVVDESLCFIAFYSTRLLFWVALCKNIIVYPCYLI